ncbi:hypothetical protein DDF62_22040 [Caulobacter radicis]|uniref:hypothetical protein n=1 Tax=Caulobacter radicis TaxID=2172650 RepID=UPI000D57B2E4|nr:hypothetical protein [Caulobacter radicis]PVM84419.1 hypothetical protein DDF62_22040 [Caulobacter radicis]
MARSDHLERLRQINRVRALQSQVAQAAAARAAAELEEARARRDRGDERLAQNHEHWAAALAAPSMALEVVSAWGVSIDAARAELGVLETRLADVGDLADGRAKALRLAQARERQAEQVERSATRRARRAREEAQLAEVADRTTQRTVGR